MEAARAAGNEAVTRVAQRLALVGIVNSLKFKSATPAGLSSQRVFSVGTESSWRQRCFYSAEFRSRSRSLITMNMNESGDRCVRTARGQQY